MATWIDSSVDITTEVAFGSDPWDASPTWTDVSAYVRGFSTRRGGSSETAIFSPGSLRITLSNGDRRFDPDYASSPYSGNIVPMKRIRVTATRSAVTFTLFLGWVAGWQQGWGHTDGVVYADCVDGGYFVQSEALAPSAYAAEVLADSPIHYWPLGASETTRDLVGDVTLIANETPTISSSLSAPVGASSAMQSGNLELGVPPSAKPKAVEFWLNISPGGDHDFASGLEVRFSGANMDGIYLGAFLTTPAGTTDIGYIYGDPAITRSVSSVGVTPWELRPGHHHLAFYVDASNAYLMVDGVVVVTDPLDSANIADSDTNAIRIGADALTLSSLGNGAISHVAVYSTAPSSSRFQAHYLAGLIAYGHPYGEREGERISRCLTEINYPANLTDVSDGTMVQGPYLPAERPAMEYIGDCVVSGQGLLFFSVDGKLTYRDRQWQWTQADADGVVFSDDGASGSVSYDQGSPNSGTIDTVRNIVTVSYSNVGGITNRDQTSIDAYGPSREFIDGPTIPNGTSASNLGKYVLRNKKDPKSTIPELVVKMRKNMAAHFAPVCGLEIGDVVTVERTPMGVGSQVVRRHQVTGISHEVTTQDWTVTFYLSPAVEMYDEAPYFTLGDATYGQLGATAGNLIPG